MDPWYPLEGDPLAVRRHDRGTVRDPLYPILVAMQEGSRFLDAGTAHRILNDVRLLMREFGPQEAMTTPADDLIFDRGYRQFGSVKRKRLRRGQRALWAWLGSRFAGEAAASGASA